MTATVGDSGLCCCDPCSSIISGERHQFPFTCWFIHSAPSLLLFQVLTYRQKVPLDSLKYPRNYSYLVYIWSCFQATNSRLLSVLKYSRTCADSGCISHRGDKQFQLLEMTKLASKREENRGAGPGCVRRWSVSVFLSFQWWRIHIRICCADLGPYVWTADISLDRDYLLSTVCLKISVCVKRV